MTLTLGGVKVMPFQQGGTQHGRSKNATKKMQKETQKETHIACKIL